MYTRLKKTSTSGFTIVELLIVIVVIGILAAITIVAYNGITAKANISAAQSAAAQAGNKIALYAASNADQVPPDLATAGLTNSGNATYQYSPNNFGSIHNYCLTATVNSVSYSIATGGSPIPGPCPGHTGTSPNTLPDGTSCPTGYIVVPGSSLYGTAAFCVMKYEAKNDGSGKAVSVAAGAPWVNISQVSAVPVAAAACSGCHLITEAQWLTIAQNLINVASNWSGGSVGSGYIYSGHNDDAPDNPLAASTSDTNGYFGETNTGGNQRRTLTLSNGNVIWDFAGNVIEAMSDTYTGSQPGGSGYAWRDWNNMPSQGSLPLSPFPFYGVYGSGSWSSAQGIGQLFSDTNETATMGYFGGGAYWDWGAAGVYSLNMSGTPNDTAGFAGFRVTKG